MQVEQCGNDFKPTILLYGINFKCAFASVYQQNHIQKHNVASYTHLDNLIFFWSCIMNWLYIKYQLDALIIIYS